MKESNGTLNEKWAKQLIRELVNQGVRYFCIAPGSRSTPLIMAASEQPLAETLVHFDERGLCFHALGYAKATNFPAALIVTSGTAVGNLLPGVMEAHHDHVPMILLTADRPPELRSSGANQTSDQVKIFQNFVRFQKDVPCPSRHISLSFIGSTVATAISHALTTPAGPVQLNCMFREPFFQEKETLSLPAVENCINASQTKLAFGEKTLSDSQIEMLANELSEYERGVIIVGALPIDSPLKPLLTLSRLLQWPIFPDITSPLRSYPQTSGVIPYYDLILSSLSLNEDLIPDAILQFGNRFVSKKLLEWIGLKQPKCYALVASHEWCIDPLHFQTYRLIAHPAQVINALCQILPRKSPSSWINYWNEMNRRTRSTLTYFFKQHPAPSQPILFHSLSSWIGEDTSLFFGNSLSIREANAFLAPNQKIGPIFGNRGVSGIDGNIATAIGLAKGLNQPLLAIIGDLTFLHDLPSLAQLKNSRCSIRLLVINNDGGGIFSFLPIAKQKALFETYFATPHGLDLKHAATLFQLSYKHVKTLLELEKVLTSPPSPILIEMHTNRNETISLHQTIISHLKEVLNCSSDERSGIF